MLYVLIHTKLINGREELTKMHLHNERKVEMRAWERYGGPGNFEKM